MEIVYCVFEEDIYLRPIADYVISKTTRLLKIFKNLEDAERFAKERIDYEEQRLRKINGTRNFNRASDNEVRCGGFAYLDVKYKTTIRAEPIR